MASAVLLLSPVISRRRYRSFFRPCNRRMAGCLYGVGPPTGRELPSNPAPLPASPPALPTAIYISVLPLAGKRFRVLLRNCRIDPVFIHDFRFPARTLTPPTTASMPRPGIAFEAVGTFEREPFGTQRPRRWCARWVAPSSAPPKRQAPGPSAHPGHRYRFKSVSFGLPSVIVPVLSRTIVFIYGLSPALPHP
jgi:hypothetical protein